MDKDNPAYIIVQLQAAWKNYKRMYEETQCTCQPLTVMVKGCQCDKHKVMAEAWYRLIYWLNQFETIDEVKDVDG